MQMRARVLLVACGTALISLLLAASGCKNGSLDLPDKNGPPRIASFQASPVSGPAPLTVQFSAAAIDSGGSGLSYRLDFGDGARAHDPSARHMYAEGQFTAVLTVRDSGGAVAVASWAGGEIFLTAMGAIGCLMTLWVGALTLIRG